MTQYYYKLNYVSNVLKQVLALMKPVILVKKRWQRYIHTTKLLKQISVYAKNNVREIQSVTDILMMKTITCAL